MTTPAPWSRAPSSVVWAVERSLQLVRCDEIAEAMAGKTKYTQHAHDLTVQRIKQQLFEALESTGYTLELSAADTVTVPIPLDLAEFARRAFLVADDEMPSSADWQSALLSLDAAIIAAAPPTDPEEG